MSIDLKTLRRIAELARLDPAYGLGDDQAQAAEEELAGELSGLIRRIDVLSEADTEGVEPLYSLIPENLGDRADVPRDDDLTEDILSQAPERSGDFFAVPKII